MYNLKSKIEKVIEDKLNFPLQAHGGGVEIVEVDEKNGLVKVKFEGMCVGCPMAQMTFDDLIKETLLSEIKELKEVSLVN